jgi:hypothetical protein
LAPWRSGGLWWPLAGTPHACGTAVGRWPGGAWALPRRVAAWAWSTGAWRVDAAAVGWRLAKWAAGEVAREAGGAAGEVGRWRGKRLAASGLGLGFRPTTLRDSGSAGCGRAERTADCVCVLRSAECCTAVRRLICIRDLGLAPACGLRKSGSSWPIGRWRAPRCRVNYIGLPGSGSRAVNGSGRVVLGFPGRTGQPTG